MCRYDHDQLNNYYNNYDDRYNTKDYLEVSSKALVFNTKALKVDVIQAIADDRTALKLIVSIICTQLNLGHLAPCGREPVVISLNSLLLNMNSTNETLLFDRFLIMYNLCVFTCIIFVFVFHCTHERMSYVLNSYLLTYLLQQWR